MSFKGTLSCIVIFLLRIFYIYHHECFKSFYRRADFLRDVYSDIRGLFKKVQSEDCHKQLYSQIFPKESRSINVNLKKIYFRRG